MVCWAYIDCIHQTEDAVYKVKLVQNGQQCISCSGDQSVHRWNVVDELAFQSIWDILEPFLPLTFAMETCILATVRAV